MKKILAGLVVLTMAFTISAAAQNAAPQTKNKTSFNHKGNHHHGMSSQLNLTESQKSQLKTNREAYKQQLDELNKNESITVKDFRDKKYALKKEQKEKFLALLTPEQKTKLEQFKQQKEQQRQAGADMKLDKMKTKLGLSDDQVSQLKDQRKTMHDKLKAIKENDNLSRTEKKEQLEALKTESKDSFKKILTPDQLNKMEEMRKEKRQGGKEAGSWGNEDKNPT